MKAKLNRKLTVRVITQQKDKTWFDQQMADHHYLGAGRPVGDYLRQCVYRDDKPIALFVWGPSSYALKDRDLWIGWSANHRVERLKLIVQNRRFLLLSKKGAEPNLASQAMGVVLRALPEQWHQHFGYRPLLAESFTDREAYHGTCYKASNWEAVGTSAGYSRHRADFYIANDRPKRLWMKELTRDAKRLIRATELPSDSAKGCIAPPSGVLPISQAQLPSLRATLSTVTDPRRNNTRYRTGSVLTIIAMALLAGRREIAEIARFATTLRQPQRRLLGLPRKKQSKAFYQVPGYSVFYEVLRRLDPEVFASALAPWLQQRVGILPGGLAMDGKMIRDQIGLLSLAQHEDGAPQAVAVYDQKEHTPRCEQTAAANLLATIPCLDGKIITADALHCQRNTARVIVEKGGEYLLKLKNNQPKLFQQAKDYAALDVPLFFTHTDCIRGQVIVRRLRVFALDPMEADFPFVRTLLVIDKEVTQKKSGKVHTQTHYAISSAEIGQYSPAQWCGLYLGHWRGAEILNHWIRDVYWGEDKSRTRHVNILANLALLRNALLAILPDHFADQSFPVIQETLRANPTRCLKILSS